MNVATPRQVFNLFLIKPSHYDDDGYVIQWARSSIPANTLAALYGLALECAERRVLGADVEIRITVWDETNTRIRPERIVGAIRAGGGRGLVGLVGVQTNQFPRAVDIARPLVAAGVPVVIGGFHVSGCLAMLPELPPDLREAMALGITLFAGEAEGRFEELLQAAHAGTLAPLYNYMKDLPGLEGAATPYLPLDVVRRTSGTRTSFDAGRGCPFLCSFCTIINVQGRKSRARSADDVTTSSGQSPSSASHPAMRHRSRSPRADSGLSKSVGASVSHADLAWRRINSSGTDRGSSAPEVLEVRPVEAIAGVGIEMGDLGIEATQRIAAAFDMGVVGGEHADLGSGLLDDPACRFGGIRRDPHLASHVVRRGEAQPLEPLLVAFERSECRVELAHEARYPDRTELDDAELESGEPLEDPVEDEHRQGLHRWQIGRAHV